MRAPGATEAQQLSLASNNNENPTSSISRNPARRQRAAPALRYRPSRLSQSMSSFFLRGMPPYPMTGDHRGNDSGRLARARRLYVCVRWIRPPSSRAQLVLPMAWLSHGLEYVRKFGIFLLNGHQKMVRGGRAIFFLENTKVGKYAQIGPPRADSCPRTQPRPPGS